ncbi:MAG: hypothetical protein MZW92_68395 [Comamonadaceae bacterium]|nr:hypothetical protein [Comamonadaceae bacterium]
MATPNRSPAGAFRGRAWTIPQRFPWLDGVFRGAGVDGFASSHTCLPVCRSFDCGDRRRFVINNGAAGMPNFVNSRFGVVTRIALRPSPHRRLYGLRLQRRLRRRSCRRL